jgi:hypothetical protein
MRKAGLMLLAVATVMLSAGSVGAAEKVAKPDATLKFTVDSVAAGVGVTWGKGTLKYKGKDHRFKVEGLSVGSVGGSEVAAEGVVYDLKKLEDFNGNFTAATAQATLGGGAGATAMKNQSGVRIQITSTTRGVDLKVAGEGLRFQLEK